MSRVVNKHLMTGPKGNREFCFPETLTKAKTKVLDLITCESKVQVVVALERHEVLFALGRHEVLTNDT